MKPLLTGLLLALLGGAAQAEVAVPPLVAHVTDLTATLTPDQRAALEGQLAQFESRKGSQVAVLVVPTTAPETIEQYGIRVAEAWKLGRKGVDDGAILLIAKDDRALRIEVGYGLEGALPDVIAKRIIEEVIVPRFKENDFYGGIAAGTDRIIRVIDGEQLPEPAPQTLEGSINSDKIFTAVVPAVIFGAFLRMFMGRLPGALVAAALSAAIVWFLLGVLLPAVLVALLSFVLVLFGNAGGGFGGGGRGGGGWSGGGGFSGGGGGFGGGGASGRW